jgi:hypothetical protein
MKVFITVEKDGVPTGNDSLILRKCIALEEALHELNAPVQLKITSLPREKRT